jgi:predicted metalloprotease
MLLPFAYLLASYVSGATAADHALASSVSSMFDATQRAWSRTLANDGKRYVAAQMVLFRAAVDSRCGPSQPAMGSFYCALDGKVYVDFEAYFDLRRRFAASADLAMAFIVSHEVAHHVQSQLDGGRVGGGELEADCLAGVSWHARKRGARERANLEQAVRAAVAVGAHGPPEASAHGSPSQRLLAFRSGLDSGRISTCRKPPSSSFAKP